MPQTRRNLLVAGTAALTVTLAGCPDNDEPVEEPVDDDDDEPADDVPQEIADHMEEANGYDGTITDMTGEAEITIDVGDPEGGANYMFDPSLPRIDAGTTVVWEWIDDDAHSVTHTDGDEFDSGIEADYTFEHTFEEPGNYLYHCEPHRALGHIGALIVE